jgi:hypothetical protein
MRFNAEQYYEAAIERMRQARFLYHQEESYALAIYIAGLAVECMLRAYKERRNPIFDERHDLSLLFDGSGMTGLNEPKLLEAGWSRSVAAGFKKSLQSDIEVIHRLWNNKYRYASERRLRTELREKGFHHKIKGDFLKANAFRMIEASRTFIERGVLAWNVSLTK